jgi:predicted transcriptional regulator
MEINFACRMVNFKEILTCAFSMNKSEYDLFLFLEKQKDPLCVATISEMMNKDRTTIQKSIKSLNDKEIVDKFQVNLDKGGYTFVYKLKDKLVLKKRINESVNKWFNSVNDYVRNW